MSKPVSLLLISAVLFCAWIFSPASAARRVPTWKEAAAARADVWAESAIRAPGGPSYSFFRSVMPPLRYVDAPFLYYPIALSAPGAPVKARLVSNGSVINARANQPNWINEEGIPATIRVGYHREVFGTDPGRLEGPHYVDGYLPIVRLSYRTPEGRFSEEVFAATSPQLADAGVVLMKLTYQGSGEQKIEVQLQHDKAFIPSGDALTLEDGRAVAWHDKSWDYNKYRNALTVWIKPGASAFLAFATEPLIASAVPALDAAAYTGLRQGSLKLWKSLVDAGMTVSVPESVVNNAWRALIIGSYVCLNGAEIRYSAGNQYAKLYESEGGDAAKSFIDWGRMDDAKRMTPPLLDFTRKNMEFHQAALKLSLLARLYWLTHDADFIRQMRPRWEKEVTLILNGRAENGLLPREKYCGDIDTMVYSLNSNSNCWRALRDFSVVVKESGDAELATKMSREAAKFRAVILDAVEKSVDYSVSPPFVPIALSGEEKPYDPITGSFMGGYWNLMIQYVLGSGVFPYNSKYADFIIDYDRQRGGLCMNLLRTRGNTRTFWIGQSKINDLYTLRHNLVLFQRDDVDRALVAFYGKLAQGMTPDTFISGEAADTTPLDARGRLFYLPPNSAGNAHFLELLRNLLVQDWDMDDDGRPETLRLLYATPRRWLEDGKQIQVQRAPTPFGPVSITASSQLSKGRVIAGVTMPERPPRRALMRLRLPDGWRITSVTVNGKPVKTLKHASLDLTGLSGRLKIIASVRAGRK